MIVRVKVTRSALRRLHLQALDTRGGEPASVRAERHRKHRAGMKASSLRTQGTRGGRAPRTASGVRPLSRACFSDSSVRSILSGSASACAAFALLSCASASRCCASLCRDSHQARTPATAINSIAPAAARRSRRRCCRRASLSSSPAATARGDEAAQRVVELVATFLVPSRCLGQERSAQEQVPVFAISLPFRTRVTQPLAPQQEVAICIEPGQRDDPRRGRGLRAPPPRRVHPRRHARRARLHETFESVIHLRRQLVPAPGWRKSGLPHQRGPVPAAPHAGA